MSVFLKIKKLNPICTFKSWHPSHLCTLSKLVHLLSWVLEDQKKLFLLPKEAVGCLSLDGFQNRLDKHLSGMVKVELSLPWGRGTDKVTPCSPFQPYFVQSSASFLECSQCPFCAEQFTCSLWQKSLNSPIVAPVRPTGLGALWDSALNAALSIRSVIQCGYCLQCSCSWRLIRKKAVGFTGALRSLGSEWQFHILRNCLLWLCGDSLDTRFKQTKFLGSQFWVLGRWRM